MVAADELLLRHPRAVTMKAFDGGGGVLLGELQKEQKGGLLHFGAEAEVLLWWQHRLDGVATAQILGGDRRSCKSAKGGHGFDEKGCVGGEGEDATEDFLGGGWGGCGCRCRGGKPVDESFLGREDGELLNEVIGRPEVGCADGVASVRVGGACGKVESGDAKGGRGRTRFRLDVHSSQIGGIGGSHGLDVCGRGQDAANLSPQHSAGVILDLVNNHDRPPSGREAASVLVQNVIGEAGEQAVLVGEQPRAAIGELHFVFFDSELDAEKIGDGADIQDSLSCGSVLDVVELIEGADHQEDGGLRAVLGRVGAIEFDIFFVHSGMCRRGEL